MGLTGWETIDRSTISTSPCRCQIIKAKVQAPVMLQRHILRAPKRSGLNQCGGEEEADVFVKNTLWVSGQFPSPGEHHLGPLSPWYSEFMSLNSAHIAHIAGIILSMGSA